MREMIGLVVLTTACGGADFEDAKRWDLEDPPENNQVVDAPACDQNSDCAEDEYCHRPSLCGEPKYCVEGFEPWSAAPPTFVCDCGGGVISVNAGYPGPFSWRLNGEFEWFTLSERCDPAAKAPYRFTIEFRAEEMARENIKARLNDSLETQTPIKELVDGTVTYEASGEMTSRFGISLFEDVDNDGICSPDLDRTFRTYIENGAFDAERFDLVLNLGVSEDTNCDGW